MTSVTASRSVGRALAFLGVEPAERRSAGLMFAHSFFMGCATVFFETAASATFLSRFPSSDLPWVYIAAAAVNTVTGAAYSRAQSRVSFAGLMRGTLWFLLVIAVSVRLGLAISGMAWVAFAGLVSYRIMSSLTDLEYWAVASRIYDVRQAKRLFGLIGTGEVIARTAGAFSIPLLVKLGGVPNLMLLSSGGLTLCLVFARAVLRPVANAHVPPQAQTPRASGPAKSDLLAGVREIAGSPYLSVVVGVAILATFGKYFVDFAYLEQMSTLSSHEDQLAAFLGVFNGATQTISLLTRTFVSRPMLARFGIRVGVVILPVLHAICSAVTVVGGLFLGFGASAIFWCMLGNQGIYKSFKHPIDNASFKVLYQPLKPEQRLLAQIAVEIIFSPVVVGLAGGVMLLFTAWMHYDPVKFSTVLLFNFVAWAFLARAAGRGYARKLLDMLARRIEGNVTLTFDDGTTLRTLRARLESPAPDEVCAALDLLERAQAPDLLEILRGKIAHESAAVRQHALERLLTLRPAALRELRARISMDPAPSVRTAAVRAAATGGSRSVSDVLPFLEDPDLSVRRAAVEVLFGAGTSEGSGAACDAVAKLVQSTSSDERALGAALAGEHGIEHHVSALLADTNLDVRRAALLAAGKLRAPTLRKVLVAHLSDARFAHAAARALASEGPSVLPELMPLFREGASNRLLRRLVYVFALVAGPQGIAALAEHVDFPDATVRTRVHAALDRLGWVAEGSARDTVKRVIVAEAHEAAWTLGARRDLAGDPSLEPLVRALDGEVAEARRRIFHLLACAYDRVTVHRAAAHIADAASKDRRAYAHEVLEVSLDRDIREHVMPLLDDARPEERLARIEERSPQPARTPAERIAELAHRPRRWLGWWTRALVARATKNQEEPMLLIEKVIILKTVPMFAAAKEELLAEIAATLEDVDVAAGKTIFEKGDAGDSMYVVVAGKVRVSRGTKTLSELGEREIFGELALLDPQPRSATVTAVEDTHLFRLDADTFAQLMAGNLEIVRGVLHVLCQRLRKTSADADALT